MIKPLEEFRFGEVSCTIYQESPEGKIVIDFGVAGARLLFATKDDFSVFTSHLMSAELRAQ